MKTCITAITLTACTFGFAGDASAQYGGSNEQAVSDWYARYLGRRPDPSGFRNHVAMLNRGTPPDFVEAGILGSEEYFQRNGNSPEGFIHGLYRDALGTTPGPAELNGWMRRLHYAESLHTLTLQFLQETRGGAFQPEPLYQDRYPGAGYSPPAVYGRPHHVHRPPVYSFPGSRPGLHMIPGFRR